MKQSHVDSLLLCPGILLYENGPDRVGYRRVDEGAMKPLDNVKVLEFSTMVTASFAAMMMAEQGAEVIKVEPLELGDPMRYLGTAKGGISALFANCNRGKRSIRVNLADPEGQELAARLAADADVLIHNFRPGVMDRLNLGSARLRGQNPRLINRRSAGSAKRARSRTHLLTTRSSRRTQDLPPPRASAHPRSCAT
jgi:hypothetical protein